MGLVEAHGKAVIQQRAHLEAVSQAQQQELGELRREVARLREDQQEGAPLSAPATPRANTRRRAKRQNTAEKTKVRRFSLYVFNVYMEIWAERSV